jgi:hypothetical protein
MEKTVGRPRLRWKDIRRDSLLLLNVRQWRTLSENKDIWRRILKRYRPDASCRATEEVEEEAVTFPNFKMSTAR